MGMGHVRSVIVIETKVLFVLLNKLSMTAVTKQIIVPDGLLVHILQAGLACIHGTAL